MSATKKIRATRDGDQFHYLWAARRCLLLLTPQTDLVAVSIEGASPGEIAAGSNPMAGEESIDIAEYYGSEDLAAAKLIRYLQLKHSTLQVGTPWTASGLKKTIQDFSKRFNDLNGKFSPDELLERFEFHFVTNRPISTDFTEAITDTATLSIQRHPKELKKIEELTGLTGATLAGFCKLLHLEGGQGSYWDQRNILFQEMSGYLPDCDYDAPMQLKELVTRKALTEADTNPTITKMDVLRALKTEESQLYPKPCLIKEIENAVCREQEIGLIQEIVQAGKRPVIFHALAGVGKSVFSTHISKGLPDGSVTVLYDCFGNGQYRSATGYRHRHQEALVQIANELAAKGLCHPLIPTTHADSSAYLRAFSYRLQQAIAIIRVSNPQALLCIVIDAADNAQMISEEIGQLRSFARDLLREALPDGARLVALCRTHRIDKLDPPPEALQLELKSFSRNETAAYLRQTFPNASEQDVDEFHRLSSNNPRVQALALSRKLSLPETLRLLGPNPTTVESTIGSLLEDAIAKLRDNVGTIEREQVDMICSGLATLRPLIPIPILSLISGVPEGAVRSFVLDLGRPLLVTGNAIQFLDEPVETWFRDKFKPSSDTMVEFIRGLTPLATKSAYVASMLPQLMLEAGQFSELVALALTSTALPDTSLLEKRDVELQRLQFALKASLRAKRYLDAAKLALKAGGETAGDDRQRKFIQANTDLAAKFIDTDLVQETVSRRTFGSGWTGSHNVYEAGLLSGCTELIGDARSRLRMAQEWLYNWSRLSPEEREDEQVSVEDIAELAMAHLNIHGAGAAAFSLSDWRPHDVPYRAARIVASRLIDHGRFSDLDALALAAGNNLCLVLAFIVELRDVQQLLPIQVIKRAFMLVSNLRVNLKGYETWNSNESVLYAVTFLVEAALKLSLCSKTEAVAVLTRYLPGTPPRGLSSRFSSPRSAILRSSCLRAALEARELKLLDFAHPELRAELEKSSHSLSQDAREFNVNIGTLLPWYQLWALTLLGEVTKETLATSIAQAVEVSRRAAQTDYRNEPHAWNEIAIIWFEILHYLDLVDAAFLDPMTSWIKNLSRPLFTPTLIALARLGARKEATKMISLQFAAQAFVLTQEERSDAESKSDGYIQIARSVLTINSTEAKAYFNEAVAVAGKLGEENLARWDAILDLADRAARSGRPVPEVAYQFARCAELTYEYVDRDKHFAWNSTVRALSALCPISSFAILSRWRDRGFGRSERILPIAAQFLIEYGSIDARDILPLVCFEAEWDYSKLLSSVLDKCASHLEKEAAITFLLRYVRWESRTSSEWGNLKELTAKHKLSVPDLDANIASIRHEEQIANERKDEHLPEGNTANELSERNWNEIFGGHDLTTVDGISQAHDTFSSRIDPNFQEHFIEKIFLHVPPGSETDFIVALGNTPEFSLYYFRHFLEKLPESWKGRPAIKQSIESTLKTLCRNYCMQITKNRYFEILPFDLACNLSGIAEENLAEIVLDAISESSDQIEVSRLFSLIGLLTSKLSQDEALEALAFGLGYYDSVLEESDGDGPWCTLHILPPTIDESIAGYIYAGLAAPPSYIRWQAAHSVVALCAFERGEVLRHLVDLADSNLYGPFTDSQLPFYQLNAFQWLMIAFARAAHEFPAAMGSFASRFVTWALIDQPHVMIRMFAARTALTLIKSGTLTVGDEIIERLSMVNVSSLPIVKSKSFERIAHDAKRVTKVAEDDRFYFGIDIGPYWYEPLGRVFGLTQNDIEIAALEVIRHELHNEGTRGRDEEKRRKQFEHQQTYASHGAYPDTDNQHFYLCYHAMMIVAGKLLATKQTHRDTEWSDNDEFTEWISGHDLSRHDGRWLADRRDIAPLEWPIWLDKKKDDPAYKIISIEDFEQALISGDNLNIWGRWTTADSVRQQSVDIRSALVTSDKSIALLRALSTAKSVHDYLIPSADADQQINRPGFELEGWIEDRSQERGLDGKDRWSGGVHFPPPAPATQIINLMALTTDLDRREWRDGKNIRVMSSSVWGTLETSNEENNPKRGERMQASLPFVKDMLSKFQQDLIIEVRIDRHRQYRRYESKQDDERIPKATRLYLIKADGSITSL